MQFRAESTEDIKGKLRGLMSALLRCYSDSLKFGIPESPVASGVRDSGIRTWKKRSLKSALSRTGAWGITRISSTERSRMHGLIDFCAAPF